MAVGLFMRLLICSTPKTGNTWLKNLLSAIYSLPVRLVGTGPDDSDLDHLGDAWVCHEHYYPTADLRNWARINQPILITTVRHPADVLVSLYHHAQHYPWTEAIKSAVTSDTGKIGENVRRYVEHLLFLDLNISIAWMRTKLSHIVRYEDLWEDPVGELTRLTNLIQPVGKDVILQAVERCDLSLMREKADPRERPFYRKGGTGHWREVLTAEITQLLAEMEPYPQQFAFLGYSLETADRPIATPSHGRHSIVHLTHFDNGVAVCGMIKDAYLSGSADVARRWGDPATTRSAQAFYTWLNAPCERIRQDGVLITNLAYHLYQCRPDLAAAFPNLEKDQRACFARWFVQNAQVRFGIAPEFISAMESSLMQVADPN
jgi:hypothetical protein